MKNKKNDYKYIKYYLSIMFDYEYNEHQKHTMIISQLVYYTCNNDIIMNIIYDKKKDTEKVYISTNINDFGYDNKQLSEVKNNLLEKLNIYFDEYDILNNIRDVIHNKIEYI
jgi:hypothetical protein